MKKEIPGNIIIVGFGSVGKAILPLLRKHLTQTEESRTVIIAPDDSNRLVAAEYQADFVQLAITPQNYEQELSKYVGIDKPRGFIINVANEVDSKDLARFSAVNNAHYLDTVVEPWPGFYFDHTIPPSQKSNYALRESFQELRRECVNTPTAISCCGANPGMVSWFVKEALLILAEDLGLTISTPQTRTDWAQLMQALEIKGIHIAERDTQRRERQKMVNEFVNTWSVEGFAAEGLQPAELGWGTHEKHLPPDGNIPEFGSKSAIYLDSPGASVRVKTWTPDNGEHFGFLITHNEAISISDYYSITNTTGETIYRPTCHYAYHPTDDAVTSLEELLNDRGGAIQDTKTILTESEIVSGADQLGVLLYGHKRGAFWYGSTLTIDETRRLAPYQNATGLQVSSAIIAGMLYCLENPNLGIIETDETDHQFCLDIQRPYLGRLSGHYTNWMPGTENDPDPWQFSNIRLT